MRGSLGAETLACRSAYANVVPVASPILTASARIASWIRRILASSRSRSSREQTTVPGMTLRAPGLTCETTDGADLATRRRAHHAIDHVDEARRRQQRVLPLVHRRRPGVVGKAGHRHVPLADADDALDDADGHALGFEDAALLDVQFEVGRDAAAGPPHLASRVGSPPTNAMPSPHRLAAGGHVREFGGLELATHRAAAEQPAFLVGPDRDFDRMPQHVPAFLQHLRDLDRPEGADVAVVAAAVGHRIDVRAEDDRRQVGAARRVVRSGCRRSRWWASAPPPASMSRRGHGPGCLRRCSRVDACRRPACRRTVAGPSGAR